MKNVVSTQPKKMTRATYAAFSLLLIPMLVVACGKSEWHETKTPNTGDPAAEAHLGDLQPQIVQPGQTAYVAPDRLRARETETQDPEQSQTLLDRNQPVKIVDATPVGVDQVVGVELQEYVPPVATVEPRQVPPKKTSVKAPRVLEAPKAIQLVPKAASIAAPKTKKVYVPLKYLKSKPTVAAASESEADRYIMIQNIATEKLRVYERSNVVGGPNRLVLETDMIAGENDPAKTRRTAVGSYKIEKWIKFYQDVAGLFPSWQDAKLASLPLPGSELQDWTQSYLMPQVNGQPSGLVRGAFGWFTAKIGPNAHAQWTHGTLGWGADKDRFIKLPKTQLAQFYSDPRSFGCTRVENQAIAYLQDLLPVGTRVVKVYAKETIADNELSNYKHSNAQRSFEWVLSSDEVRKEYPNSISRPNQILRAVPKNDVLEVGTYSIDTHPDAVTFKKTVHGDRLSATVIRPEANLYDLPETSFQGEFLVDEGRFVNYKHPRELRSGGYSDQLLPGVVVKR
ncbi:hypothetical protein BH10BDE1_BH10BDE1_26220 [soil metagenome]